MLLLCWIVWQTKRAFLSLRIRIPITPFWGSKFVKLLMEIHLVVPQQRPVSMVLLLCQDFNVVQPQSPLWKWPNITLYYVLSIRNSFECRVGRKLLHFSFQYVYTQKQNVQQITNSSHTVYYEFPITRLYFNRAEIAGVGRALMFMCCCWRLVKSYSNTLCAFPSHTALLCVLAERIRWDFSVVPSHWSTLHIVPFHLN